MRTVVVSFLLGVACLFPAAAQDYIITTIAGGGLPATGLPVGGVVVDWISGIATDPAGNLYFTADNCVFRVTRLGMLERIAGHQAARGFFGDGGPAIDADLSHPSSLALDRKGNVYVTDTYNDRIRMINPAGIINTVAGNGHVGYTGDGGPATSAELAWPEGLAVDNEGNLLIADSSNNAIRTVTPDGIITTLTAILNPKSLVVDKQGTVYSTDGITLIRKLTPNGNPPIAGNGYMGFAGDEGPATSAELNQPMGLSVDEIGNLYFVDVANNRVREIARNGVISTIAGGGNTGDTENGIPARSAALDSPAGTAVDDAGRILFMDSFLNLIRIIGAQGLQTVVGNFWGFPPGEGGPAAAAQLQSPGGSAVDTHGNLYFADFNKIRRAAPDGTITTLGAGQPGSPGGYVFGYPYGVAVDASDNIYVSNVSGNQVMRIGADGALSLVAGNDGSPGYSGDGGSAANALLNSPRDLALDAAGNLYIADSQNFVIRKVDPSGIINTVAGNGIVGDPPDGVLAATASIAVLGMTVDAPGNIYFADNGRVRMISAATGLVSTIAGGGSALGNNVPATSVWLPGPTSLAVDSSGNVYILDIYTRLLSKVSAATGLITTIAGNGVQGYSGDMGLATSASFGSPLGLALDSHGNLYVSDSGNSNVRMVSPAGTHPVLGVSLTSLELDQEQSRRRVVPLVSVSAAIANAQEAARTIGAVVVTATPSYSATLISMTGPGWDCVANRCSRMDPLHSGENYPPIAIEAESLGQTTIQVAVTGGGAPPCAASFLTNVPDMTHHRHGPKPW